MALPQANRLRRRRDFSAVYQAGLRRNATHLTLRALRLPAQQASFQTQGAIATTEKLPDSARPATCIGISISQKVSKRAVVRNRIKRQIHSAVYHLLPDICPGWHCVIVVKPGAIQCDYQQFLQELKQLFTEAEVINGHQGRGVF